MAKESIPDYGQENRSSLLKIFCILLFEIPIENSRCDHMITQGISPFAQGSSIPEKIWLFFPIFSDELEEAMSIASASSEGE